MTVKKDVFILLQTFYKKYCFIRLILHKNAKFEISKKNISLKKINLCDKIDYNLHKCNSILSSVLILMSRFEFIILLELTKN